MNKIHEQREVVLEVHLNFALFLLQNLDFY